VPATTAIGDTYLRVRAGGEHYALPVAEALEVIELGRVDPVPGAPASALGVRAVRGQPLPIFDLALLLCGGGKSTSKQVVVAEHASGQLGLAVDEVLEVAELPLDRDQAEPAGVRSSVLVDGMLVGVLDLDALLERLAP
jgi:purine-binding chemotaxis protein CheW